MTGVSNTSSKYDLLFMNVLMYLTRAIHVLSFISLSSINNIYLISNTTTWGYVQNNSIRYSYMSIVVNNM